MIFRLTLFLFKIGIFLCLTFVIGAKVQAQEVEDSLTVELDPIEVTAIRSTISSADAPLSLSTLNRSLETINSEAALSLESIGDKLPGLWVNDRQNYALGERLTIRGVGWRAAFGVRGIQVVMNGIPLTVADGQTMINIVDPAFIRRAELVRGPAATYWGNSSGGVLYLSTTPNYEEDPSFRLRTMAGSFGLRKVDAEFAISDSAHQMNGYTSYLTTNGYRDYSAARVLRLGVNGKINLTPKSQLRYHAASIYMPKAQHPSGLTQNQAQNNPTNAVSSFVDAEAGKTITQGQAGLSYLLQTSAGMLNVTGYGIYRDLNNPLPFGIITVDRWAGGLRSTLDKDWDHFHLQVGLESKLQHDDRTEFENLGEAQRGDITVDQIEQVWNQAIFSTATYSLNKFNFMGGIRYDRLWFSTDAPTADLSGSRTFQSISPSFGINYQPSNQTVFLNFSTSFEAPTTTELVNRPRGGNGFNPNLRPERTLGLETGIRGSNNTETILYDLTVYRLWIQDLLFPYQLESNGPTYYRNQGETRHTGIEGQLSWIINSDWKISATANLIKAEFHQAQTLDNQSLSGKNVPGIPTHRMQGKLNWSPGNFLISLSYKHISRYPVNNLNTAHNEKYGIFDAQLSYKKTFTESGIKVYPFINVKNLHNSRYNGSVAVNAFGGRYYEPAPSRSLRMGFSVNF